MLTLGAVMLSVNGALSWLHFNDLAARFEAQRAETRQRLVEQAFALRDDFGLRLQGLAGVLAALDSEGLGLFQTKAGNVLLRKHFDSHWAALQLGLGIDSLQVYARTGLPLASWPTEGPADLGHAAQVRAVIVSERAMHWTRCREVCIEFAAAPILLAGEVAGVVVLGSSPADVVNAFKRVSGADLGVLVPTLPTAAAVTEEELLPRLGLRVIELSSKGKDRLLLRQLTTIPTIAKSRDHAYLSLPYDGKFFELSFLSLDAPAGNHLPPMMVIIDDLTEARADIRKSVWNRLKGELLASLLSLLLLALLVHAPLQRMTQAVLAIPLLGRRAFSEARARIAPRTRRLLDDEIDSLDEAAIALSYRLETLETEVAAHSAETQRMLQRISFERDFSQSLLDTAPVIILTQSADGRILTLNRHGRLLLGWGEDEVPGKCFFHLLGLEGAASVTSVQLLLREIAAGYRRHVQLESILLGATGQSYEITWNHSCLSGRPGDTILILSVGIDHTERKRAESHANYLDEHDPLTDLVNRKYFQLELAQALASAHRSGHEGALLYLDLDEFRLVNDVSGHQAGDTLLRTVADGVRNVARASDLLGRLGGDELGLLLHECDRDGAIQVAEKINTRLAEIRSPGLGANHRVSASIGIVIFSDDRMDVEQLLGNADIAMYEAKKKGGASWHLYSEGEGVQEKMQDRLKWKEMINSALVEEGFVVHYQPIQDIGARQVSHYEALVRMQRVDGSLIPPGFFMEVAENSGLIREIDRCVIHQVFSKMLGLFAVGKHYNFSINLSGVSINDPRLLSFIREELSRSPMLPSHVIFEITETAAVSDFSAARMFMEAVKELGCAFALDDFGVGFSSFNYIKQLPVDYVKIDGSFVRTLVDRQDDQVFVRALAEVANGFGKKTVAEFVEDERTLNMLRSFGVDYAQGYYIGKPGPDVL